MSKATHLYPTRFDATSEERVARVYARMSGETELYEFTTKLAKSAAGFQEIMKRADRIIGAIHAGGFDALYTLGFSVTVKPVGDVSYWNTINTPSALGTEPNFEQKAVNGRAVPTHPKRFNHGTSFFRMSAVMVGA
jgi:hypothetical protein